MCWTFVRPCKKDTAACVSSLSRAAADPLGLITKAAGVEGADTVELRPERLDTEQPGEAAAQAGEGLIAELPWHCRPPVLLRSCPVSCPLAAEALQSRCNIL